MIMTVASAGRLRSSLELRGLWAAGRAGVALAKWGGKWKRYAAAAAAVGGKGRVLCVKYTGVSRGFVPEEENGEMKGGQFVS